MSQQGPPADAKQAQQAALQEVEAAQRRKRALEVNLANIEANIWAQEASYLEDSAASGGNIIKGFEAYLKPPPQPGHHSHHNHASHRRKLEPTEEDRLFSGSSVAFESPQS